MTTAAAEHASRFAARPGFYLISFREVGLPIYRLTLLCVVMANKPLPALQEFTLRALDAGFDTPSAIAEFLGLEERDLDEALYLLVADRFIQPVAEGSGRDALALTQRGADVLAEFRILQAEERTYVVDYDGLLRTPQRHRGWAMRERALRDLGAIPIAPSPPRRPAIDELDVAQVEALLREAKSIDKSRKLLDLIRSTRVDTLFIPATMLVFRARIGDEVQAAFVVDGRLSQEHELAFAEAQGPARLGLLANEGGLELAAEEVLGSSAAQTALAEVERLAVRDATEKASDERPPEGTYELLETYDHPRYLEEALESAQRRLLILSPWVKGRVVNERFLGLVRDRLRHGVDVHIGYGFGRDGSDDFEAVQALERLAAEYPNFTLKRFGDSHAKVLICDDYVIVTSFNWLSFVGDPARTLRDERGMLVRRPDVVAEATERVMTRFDGVT